MTIIATETLKRTYMEQNKPKPRISVAVKVVTSYAIPLSSSYGYGTGPLYLAYDLAYKR